MNRFRLWVLVLAGGASSGFAQVNRSFDVVNPRLDGLRVEAQVSRDSLGRFEYSYVVVNGSQSTGSFSKLLIDIGGVASGAAIQDDSSAGRIVARVSRVPICNVGLAPPARWQVGVTPRGAVLFTTAAGDPNDPSGVNIDLEQMAPGRTSPPLLIRSYDPPGVRNWDVYPDWEPSLGHSVYTDVTQTSIHGQTLGPVPLGEGEQLFRVGSNNPAVVDKFLMFRVPQQKTTTLTAGQKVFIVIKFGPTVNPATFSATWNGQNISNLFAVSADDFAAVQLEPKSGKNIFQVSIKGTKSGGQTATDSDKLIWTAP